MLANLIAGVLVFLLYYWSETIFDFALFCWQRVTYRREIHEASQPETPSLRLDELASLKCYWVRAELASNPNTPSLHLIALASSFPGAVLENRAYPLVLFEHPDFFTRLGGEFWSYRGLPRELISFAVNHSKYEIRSMVALNPSLLFSEKTSLLKDSVARVRFWMAERLSWGEVRACIFSTDEQCRAAVAHLKKCIWFRRLSRDRCVSVRVAVIGNPWFKRMRSLQRKLASDPEPQVRAKLAIERSTPTALLELLIRDSHYLVRRAVAGNFATEKSMVDGLLDDSDCRVRFVASNRSLQAGEISKETLDRLLSDPCVTLRRGNSAETCEHCPMRQESNL